ncbi:hypothetical protein [Sphingomonas bacterium]|uniref:hypothetical protein n=1 Tax=Sphingomonas bacterium TaxID=1895847 RepID=UPI0015759B95|nr:hypothetical protein [Sphingomonas bacterium]
MRGLRSAHVIAAIAAGLALAASLFGHPRIAVAILVLIVLILAASVEALRYRADHPEKRP